MRLVASRSRRWTSTLNASPVLHPADGALFTPPIWAARQDRPNWRAASWYSSASGVTRDHEPDSPARIDASSHYTIFPQTLQSGPPPAGPFRIDLPALKKEYLKLQGRVHPDRFPAQEKSKAEALSARINEAYKTLHDPLTRAQYILLHLHKIDVLSEDATSTPSQPDVLLMEVMEAQENIEQAESEERIVALNRQNEARIETTIKSLEECFATGDIEAATAETIKLRYWASLAHGLKEWTGKGSELRLQH